VDDRVGVPARSRIGRQIVLPSSKAFEIAWKGIRIRIWRSLITMSGIILAIAFLMSVWTAGGFTGAMRRVKPEDELYPLVQGVLESEALASGSVGLHFVVVEGGSSADSGAITASASIRDSLNSMPGFRAELAPPDAQAVIDLVAAGEDVRPDVMITEGVPASLAGQEVVAALRRFVEDGGFLLVYGAAGLDKAGTGEAFGGLLPGAVEGGSFAVRGAEVESSGQLGALWGNFPETTLPVTSGVAGAEALASQGGRAVVWGLRLGKGRVAWYPVTAESAAEPDQLSWFLRSQGIESTEGADKRRSLLVRLVAYGCRERFAGEQTDVRGTWLVGLSLMVCVVGITNAMLMSVTERFREIGTMKCLGALDRFIVKLFLIESSLQGVAGSLVGAVIGFALAFLRALFTFHVKDPETGKGYWLAIRFFPGTALLGWWGIALVTGVALTIVAAIYPAIRAARMEPVQAMRAEA